MRITASVAVTADGCLDDRTPQRLMISSPEDWAEVLRLRARHDAILAGAETLRRDDPSLLLRDEEARRARVRRGLRPDLLKATLTHSGDLHPDLRFFTCGDCERVVFTDRAKGPDGLPAEIVRTDPGERITARFIATELERRGVERLFVEGGARTLRMFFDEDLVDTLRLAVGTTLQVGDPAAPHLDIGTAYLSAPHVTERFGTTEVTTYRIHPDTSDDDARYLRMAIDASLRCTPSESCYCVGAVIRTPEGRLFTGYTHETSPTHHAEQEAVAKALAAGADLRGATIYTSMEPCSSRRSEPESCSELLLRLGFARVVFALYEPDRFVRCRGALNLRERGVEVRVIGSLAAAAREANRHLLSEK